LKTGPGLQLFYDLHAAKPEVNFIMFSAQNSIPLAVAATKAGVAEFLQKPFQAAQVMETVGRSLSRQDIRLIIPESIAWLKGSSPALNAFFSELRQALLKNADLVLHAEKGIDKKVVAEIVHNSSPRSKRKIITLDLSAFKRKAQEANFWTMLQEIMALPDSESIVEEKDRCGTIYFEGFEQAEEHFRQGLVNFLQARRPKIDKSIRVILSGQPAPEGFIKIAIPPLRSRKEDLPFMLESCLAQYSAKYNKDIRNITLELLSLLASYDFPGNYRELEKIVQAAVLSASSETVEIKDLPLDFIALLQIELKGLASRELTLTAAKREFEKRLYKILLDKLHGDDSAAARFLNIPRSALNQRIEDLQA